MRQDAVELGSVFEFAAHTEEGPWRDEVRWGMVESFAVLFGRLVLEGWHGFWWRFCKGGLGKNGKASGQTERIASM